ncbi:MAG: iron chelate uptake ABC transporter family permease subunit [Phycisphaerae bacterium]
MRNAWWVSVLLVSAAFGSHARAGAALSASTPIGKSAPPAGLRSITDTSIRWPTWVEWRRVLTLQAYNTRVVVLGVACLGFASGLIGAFLLLRKRALLGDALSHATLPGIAGAFMLSVALGGTGKSLPILLAGAVLSGLAGVACVLLITRFSRIKQDAALGIVLSTFFGAGVALLALVQTMRTGHAAGLESFIYGKTASMVASDAWTIAMAGAVIAGACLLLFKEFALLCFDPASAAAQGWPITLLDLVMMALVTGVTVIGLQAVGLILMIALLIIPPAAARFWTVHLPTLVLLSAAIGAVSGLFGAATSALIPRMPAGAVIVVCAGAVFVLSLLAGPCGGLLARTRQHVRLTRKVARQHLLRALYELTELDAAGDAAIADGAAPPERAAVAYEALLAARSWSAVALRRLLAGAERGGLVESRSAGRWFALTPAGWTAARRAARNHRLWEMYLITHADIAPSHVDRDADEVEHVLAPGLITQLEALLVAEHPDLAAPASPHRIEPPRAARGAGA